MHQNFSILIALCILCPMLARAQESDRTGNEFFETKIRPALVAHCYECHSTKSGKARGGLKVDSRDDLLTGGDTGPAVVARSLEKSLLFQAITYDGDYQMPPKGKLPDEVIADIRRWILMGAPDPRVTEINPDVKTVIDVEEGREFWAYRPLVRPEPPSSASSSWARTPIDQFVIAKLDEHKLKPVDDAPPRLLVRRLHFVLTGLPPSLEGIEDWTSRISTTDVLVRREDSEAGDGRGRPSYNQDAIAELVDQLLESPQYGERWGRHWMDVARFAESTGGDQNNVFQHAWRYRDWVIDAFNNDKPYDQFIREQIAGDLLPIANDQEWADNVIATGFLAVGAKLVGEVDQQKFFADLVDEQIDATTRAFLATSVSCARCHDHKFDPIPQADYYALAGIFRSTETHYGLLKAQARQATTLLDLTGLGPPPGTPPLDKEELAALIQARDDARQTVEDAMRRIRNGENVFRGTLRRIRSDRDETEAALQAYTAGGEPRVFAMGTQDRDFPLATRLLVRGELDKPAQHVPRGVLQVLTPRGKHAIPTRTTDILVRRNDTDGLGSPSYSSVSGRIELANWIAWQQNPLTARVMANRVWHWMFGRGIVRTVDDFGSTGDRPTHPELLDYLAIRFIENGWSTKKLIREVALSRTWQLSTTFNEDNFAADPDNRYLWKMHKRRLEAEAVRDAMLAVSGNLESVYDGLPSPSKDFGQSDGTNGRTRKSVLQRWPLGTLLRDVGEGNVGQNVFEPVIRAIDSNHRSVYLPRVRGVLPELLELFDAPDASLVAGSREQTSSPLQSLYLMNNPFVQRQAEGFSQRVTKRPPSERIVYAYLLALGREPREEEKQFAVSFMNDISDSRLSTQQKLTAYCQALLCTTEFSSID